MAKTHTVQEGDCCSSLAASHGFLDYKGIYDAAENADLKKTRPNPNTLVQGDKVVVPDKKEKKAPAAAGSSHKFMVKKTVVKLRILLRDKGDKPIKGKDWTLKVGGKTLKGNSPDGQISQDVDATAKSGTLEIDCGPKPAPAAPSPAPAPAPGPATYPPAIAAADFLDEPDEAYLGKDETTVRWALSIGGLPSYNVAAGVQQRLQNLGFDPFGASGDKDDDVKTKSAVSSYQTKYKLAKSGKTTDIQDDIRDRHDKAS
jgi:hypothetical protein